MAAPTVEIKEKRLDVVLGSGHRIVAIKKVVQYEIPNEPRAFDFIHPEVPKTNQFRLLEPIVETWKRIVGS